MNSVALRGVAWSFKAIPRPANGWPKAFLGNEDLTVNESVDNLRSADAFAVASRTSRQKLRRSLGGTYWTNIPPAWTAWSLGKAPFTLRYGFSTLKVP